MPRARDIGWQHGKMIAGHRHHVQCNYCHRIMIGGVTRFKKHLASRRGEIRGCEAVPQEVRELIEKHLVAWETRKTTEKKRKKVCAEAIDEPLYDDKDTESDESDRDIAAARLEDLRALHEAEEANQQITNDHEEPLVGTRDFFDPYSVVQCKNEEGSAPPRATDLGWIHGMMVNGDQQKIKCRYCQKVILGGGISRLKQHLAGERGNIAPCDKVPEDVKAQMQQHLGFKVMERMKKQKEPDPAKIPFLQCKDEANNEDVKVSLNTTPSLVGKSGKEADEGTSGKRKRRKKQQAPIDTSITQPPLCLTYASQESVDKANMAVAKFMYDAGVPFGAANSVHFQLMADAIAAVGPGYKMPSYHSLRGELLNRSAQEAADICQELRKSWEATGCTVMADKWTNQTGSIVLSFYIYCSKGTIFLKSIDASEISKSSEALLNLFDSIVQEVGPKNIVHFVTDTTPNYKAAGKMLMEKYKTFFWSACAAHCIDRMLEELGKLDEVKEGLGKAKRICQYIYNHVWILNLMREKTGGKDIVKPAVTRFVTDFITLQSIVYLKDPLQQLFTSTVWMQSAFSRQKAGLEVMETVLDPLFWSLCVQILKVTEPLLTVLQLSYSEERPSMGYIFDAMENAKKGIIDALENKDSVLLPYLHVIEYIWEEELHSPLHAAAHYLNPSIFYTPGFSTNKVIQKGLLDCIEALEPNTAAQDMITKQITFYEDAKGDFSRPVAIRGRESLAPATWWSLYAADYPDLQRFAVRILSQTCNGLRCERNLTMFQRIQMQQKNRLEHERLNNLLFVHYNLHLQERQPAVCGALIREGHDPISVEEMDFDAGEWVEDHGGFEEDELGWVEDVGVTGESVLSIPVSNMTNIADCNYSIVDRNNEGITCIDKNDDS